jgi:quercetin dioxygenase-like cupin family protein
MSDLAPLVVNADDIPAEVFAWGTLKWLCNGKLSPGAAQTVGISQILPSQRNPLHYHPNCEETLYVLAGTGRHSFNGAWVDLRPGSMICIPAGVRHNLVNTGAETLTCLICFSSGERETVFLE